MDCLFILLPPSSLLPPPPDWLLIAPHCGCRFYDALVEKVVTPAQSFIVKFVKFRKVSSETPAYDIMPRKEGLCVCVRACVVGCCALAVYTLLILVLCDAGL